MRRRRAKGMGPSPVGKQRHQVPAAMQLRHVVRQPQHQQARQTCGQVGVAIVHRTVAALGLRYIRGPGMANGGAFRCGPAQSPRCGGAAFQFGGVLRHPQRYGSNWAQHARKARSPHGARSVKVGHRAARAPRRSTWSLHDVRHAVRSRPGGAGCRGTLRMKASSAGMRTRHSQRRGIHHCPPPGQPRRWKAGVGIFQVTPAGTCATTGNTRPHRPEAALRMVRCNNFARAGGLRLPLHGAGIAVVRLMVPRVWAAL